MKMPDFCSFFGNLKLFCYPNIAAAPKHSGTEVTMGWKPLQSDFPSLFPLRCDCHFSVSLHQHSVTAVPAGNEARGAMAPVEIGWRNTPLNHRPHLGHGLSVPFLQGRLILLPSSRYSWRQRRDQKFHLQPVEWRGLQREQKKIKEIN